MKKAAFVGGQLFLIIATNCKLPDFLIDVETPFLHQEKVNDMNKVAILVLAEAESHGDLGRAVNALEVAKEFKDHGDEVQIVFDGGGTEWVGKLADSSHDAHTVYEAVKDKIKGACKFCSGAFGVTDQVKEAGVTLLDEYENHPSVRSLVQDGYQVITF